jgi:hypothetical protein
VEILGDDEADLPKPRPRHWPTAPQGADALGAAVDVTPGAPGATNGASPGPPDGGRPGDGRRSVPGDPTAALAADPTDSATGRLRAMVATVAGPESLGICGVLTALAGATTSALSPLVLAFRPEFLGGADQTPGSISESYATVLAGFGAVALALGLGGVLRLTSRSPAWARGTTGAAALLGVLLLLLSGWAIWRAGSLPGPTGGTGTT